MYLKILMISLPLGGDETVSKTKKKLPGSGDKLPEGFVETTLENQYHHIRQ
jgi:hypothetical protein